MSKRTSKAAINAIYQLNGPMANVIDAIMEGDDCGDLEHSIAGIAKDTGLTKKATAAAIAELSELQVIGWSQGCIVIGPNFPF